MDVFDGGRDGMQGAIGAEFHLIGVRQDTFRYRDLC